MPITVDSHSRVLRWAHILDWQIERLKAARDSCVNATRRLPTAQSFGYEDLWPDHKLNGEAHFTLTAARQLLRALRAFDGDDRLSGTTLRPASIRDLRDALEHWDQPAGRAQEEMRKLGVDPDSHKWNAAGEGLLGDLVDDAKLQAWARNVYADVLRIDPPLTAPGDG